MKIIKNTKESRQFGRAADVWEAEFGGSAVGTLGLILHFCFCRWRECPRDAEDPVVKCIVLVC